MLKDKLFSIKSKPVRLDLPEGVTVWLRKWTLQEKSDYHEWMTDQKTKSPTKEIPLMPLAEKVFTLTLCDEDGKPVLTPEDWNTFKECDGEFLEKLIVECVKLNGYKDAAVVDAKKN